MESCLRPPKSDDEDHSSYYASQPPTSFQSLPYELLQQIAREVQTFRGLCGILTLSKSVYAASFDVLYEDMVLVDRQLAHFAYAHRLHPDLASKLAFTKRIKVKFTRLWSEYIAAWFRDLCWLLEHVRPLALELDIFDDASTFWSIDDFTRLSASIEHLALKTLRLRSSEHVCISTAMDLVRSGSQCLTSLDISETLGDELEHMLHPREPIAQLSKALDDVHYLRNLVHFGTDGHGLRSFARHDGSYRRYFSSQNIPNLTSLAVTIVITGWTHLDAWYFMGAEWLFEQHAHKLESLAFHATSTQDSSSVSLRPQHIRLMPILRRLKASSISVLRPADFPHTLDDLEIKNCGPSEITTLNRLLASDACPPNLRKVTISCQCPSEHSFSSDEIEKNKFQAFQRDVEGDYNWQRLGKLCSGSSIDLALTRRGCSPT